jgi:hypothetical protein
MNSRAESGVATARLLSVNQHFLGTYVRGKGGSGLLRWIAPRRSGDRRNELISLNVQCLR